MTCSNCGASVPFAGRVCPCCHADKSADQTAHARAYTFGAVGGIVCGVLAWWWTAHFGWAVAGVVAGIVVGSATSVRK